MNSPRYSEALSAWAQALGEDKVVNDPDSIKLYQQNVTGLEREIPAILYPTSTEEVQRIVEIANRYVAPLWAFSTGRNWGMGSRLPAKNGCTIVDLHKMNKIRRVDTTHNYAIIEPGVTQGMLWEHLRSRKLNYVFDATGSGRDTSIIGNALDMGKGYNTERFESLSGLEVVLGNGKILRTGFGHFPRSNSTYLYKYGIGPHLDGLFAQSNYGIVTSAGFKLDPPSKCHSVFICNLNKKEDFPHFMDVLAKLRRNGDVKTVVHISNRARTRISLAPLLYDYFSKNGRINDPDLYATIDSRFAGPEFSDWSALGGLTGSRLEVTQSIIKVVMSMRGMAKSTVFTDSLIKVAKWLGNHGVPYFKKQKPLLEVIEPVYNLTKGIPTNVSLKSVFWPVQGEYPPQNMMEPDWSHSGLSHYLPIVPNDGITVQRTTDAIEAIFSEFGFSPYITLNMINTEALEGVVNLSFDRRSSEQKQKAHDCIQKVHTELMKDGILPFRVGIQNRELITDEKDPYWQTIRDLKSVLDPNNIMNPGRYNLV